MLRGHGLAQLAGPIAVLLLTLVVGAWCNSKLFRWETSQPLDKRAMLTAIAVLTLLFVAASVLAPAFEMVLAPAR
jgi:Kef-type K+ transport system membrane component KefB